MSGMYGTRGVLRVNRTRAGLLSQLGTPWYPWGDDCHQCHRNVRRGEDMLYVIKLFQYRPYCIRCAERDGLVDIVTLHVNMPVEEVEARRQADTLNKLAMNDAIRVLVQMGAQRSEATREVWEAVARDETLQTADEIVMACIRQRRSTPV